MGGASPRDRRKCFWRLTFPDGGSASEFIIGRASRGPVGASPTMAARDHPSRRRPAPAPPITANPLRGMDQQSARTIGAGAGVPPQRWNFVRSGGLGDPRGEPLQFPVDPRSRLSGRPSGPRPVHPGRPRMRSAAASVDPCRSYVAPLFLLLRKLTPPANPSRTNGADVFRT